jgi:hypothetical protein
MTRRIQKYHNKRATSKSPALNKRGEDAAVDNQKRASTAGSGTALSPGPTDEKDLRQRLKILESSNKSMWFKLKDLEKVSESLKVKVKRNKRTINLNTGNLDGEANALGDLQDQQEELRQKFEKFKARIIVTINQKKTGELEEVKRQLDRLEGQQSV